jgi:hypothetical protein
MPSFTVNMENIESYLLAEKKCENDTITVLKKPITISDDFLEFYIKISKKYPKESQIARQKPFALILLNHRILKSIYCLSELLKKGQYADFHSILRDVFEALSKSEYFLHHPEISDSWLRGEQISFSKISKKISLPEELKCLYGELCNYTHVNSQASLWEVTVTQKKPEPGLRVISMSYEPVFQKPIAYSLTMYLISFTIYAINNFIMFIKNNYDDIDIEDKDEYNRLLKQLPEIDKDYSEFSSNPKNTEWRRKPKYE